MDDPRKIIDALLQRIAALEKTVATLQDENRLLRVRPGPRAPTVATALNKHFGLSMRRTCQVLDKLFGLKFSPGGLSHAADRVAD